MELDAWQIVRRHPDGEMFDVIVNLGDRMKRASVIDVGVTSDIEGSRDYNGLLDLKAPALHVRKCRWCFLDAGDCAGRRQA